MLKRMSVPLTVLAALLLLATPALAGGWGIISLDAVPTEVHAGETLHLGFTVLQHGVTPVHHWEGVGPVEPVLSATNPETGEFFEVQALRDEGKVGHFTVDVTFPSPGAWEWQIQPYPFELRSQLEPLTVLPGVAAQAEPATASGQAVQPANARGLLAAGGAVLLLASAGLALYRRRQPATEPVSVP